MTVLNNIELCLVDFLDCSLIIQKSSTPQTRSCSGSFFWKHVQYIEAVLVKNKNATLEGLAPIVHYIEKMHHLFANGHAIFAKHFPCIRKCRSFSQNSKEDVLILLMLVALKSIFAKCSCEIISEMSFYAP